MIAINTYFEELRKLQIDQIEKDYETTMKMIANQFDIMQNNAKASRDQALLRLSEMFGTTVEEEQLEEVL
jgi:hypothetical protein